MTTYFNNPKTLEELRKQYKNLLKKYHPDNVGGSEEATKDINNEYEALFKALKDVHNQTAEDTTRQTYDNMKWDFAEDEALRDIGTCFPHFLHSFVSLLLWFIVFLQFPFNFF